MFRTRSKTVINTLKSTSYVDVSTIDIRDETRGISSFRNDTMLFYSNNFKNEVDEEQYKILDKFIEDDNFPRKAQTEVNQFDFKTPLNVVIATADPEYNFIKKYLCKNEYIGRIKSWIKSRDMGFYSIEYSYKINSHTKNGTFNPDFILKLNDEYDKYLFVEIKDDNDVSIENKGKYRAAKEHFKILNEKLRNDGINEEYQFHFLSPKDYETFFRYLNEGKIEQFVSDLDNKLEEV